MMISGSKVQKVVRACTIRLLNLGPAKHEKVAIYAVNQRMLLFTPFSVTRFAMHRIYANRINSRGMSRVFCDLRSQKTPRGILPVNSNQRISNLIIYSFYSCS